MIAVKSGCRAAGAHLKQFRRLGGENAAQTLVRLLVVK
jgi:hypothetical protein